MNNTHPGRMLTQEFLTAVLHSLLFLVYINDLLNEVS